MVMFRKPNRGKASVRFFSVILFAAAFHVIVFSLIEFHQTTRHAESLYELEQSRQTCDQAIQQLMDGSDYLTSQVQQYAVRGDRSYMDNYWREVNITKSRDAALEMILGMNITPEEYAAAENGKAESDALIQGEIWAMRMISESAGMSEKDMPEEIAAFSLSETEARLSAEQKRETAVAYIFGPEYSFSKEAIRANVNTFRNEIANRYASEAILALSKTKDNSLYMMAAFVLFFLVFAGAVIIFFIQVIIPFMGFSQALNRSDAERTVRLDEKGAKEIKQFAKAFNALSEKAEQNTRRLKRMGYYDYLTDVPNRASITEYVSRMIADGKQPLGLLIADIDNFKRFNDTYSHALGDKVLQQVARAICNAQTTENGISGRLCGEEFIIALQNADESLLRDTAERALRNVRGISGGDVALPNAAGFSITVSIGGAIWRGDASANFTSLLSMADEALYVSKNTGKNRYTLHETSERA